MEKAPANRGWFRRNRKIIGVIVLLVLIPGFSIYMINVILESNAEFRRFNGEFTHLLTVWVAPPANESELRINFYGSEQDASSDIDRFGGVILNITSSAVDGITVYLGQIPTSLLTVWVRMYFGSNTEERAVIVEVGIGMKTTTQLLGCEVSILLEPWQGEG